MVYVTGLVTDAEGQKMSKSKGNGLDPLDIIDGIGLEELVAKRTANMLQPKMAKKIEKSTRKEFPDGISAYGTDALRFTFYSIATRSRTIRFDMNRVDGYRNFCNKLWNASNFAFINTLEHVDDNFMTADANINVVDRWIMSELQQTIGAVNLAMETHRYDLAAKAIYEFVWDQFCDWYLELSKPILNSEDSSAESLLGTRRTLLTTLETVLRLSHPFLPFMTEEIWQQIPAGVRDGGATIMLQPFPEQDTSLIDVEVETEVAWIKSVVTATRNIRGEMDISFAKQIPVLFQNGNAVDKSRLEHNESLLQFLIKPESLTWLEADAQAPVSATSLVGDMQVLVPMSGLIDKDAEIQRLGKEIDRKEKDKQRAEGKINNPGFVAKAPAEVVQKEKDKVIELGSAITQLRDQKRKIEDL